MLTTYGDKPLHHIIMQSMGLLYCSRLLMRAVNTKFTEIWYNTFWDERTLEGAADKDAVRLLVVWIAAIACGYWKCKK